MHIAINTISAHNLQQDDATNTLFICQLIKKISQSINEHQYVFIVDEARKHEIGEHESIAALVIHREFKTFVSLFIWNHFKLTRLIKKLKATVVIQSNGRLSFFIKQPQVLIITSLYNHVQSNSFLGLTSLYLKGIEKYGIKNAKQIICTSNTIKNELINKYPFLGSTLSVIHPLLAETYQPIDFNEKRAIKDSFADGREYFLFTGGNQSNANLEVLLKAFSIFKRWQNSNMKLLVTGTFTKQKNDIITKLTNYKYREDVVLLNNLSQENLPKIIAGAYAIINASTYEAFSVTLLAAMKCGVPVIASNIEGNKEVCEEVALYFEKDNMEALANQLKTIYKDEGLARLHIEKGIERVRLFTNEDSANKFVDILKQSVL